VESGLGQKATTLYGTVALSFVIPSEAEGSAVPRTLPGNVFRQRNHGPCGPPKIMKNTSVRQPLFMERLPFPLSSQAKPRDLQFRGPFLEMFFDRAERNGEICGFPMREP
jgi:hypothetical protein